MKKRWATQVTRIFIYFTEYLSIDPLQDYTSVCFIKADF